MENVDTRREARVRRTATRLGYALKKSRVRVVMNINDCGEYRLVDPFTNTIVYAERFNASLDEIEAWLSEREA